MQAISVGEESREQGECPCSDFVVSALQGSRLGDIDLAMGHQDGIPAILRVPRSHALVRVPVAVVPVAVVRAIYCSRQTPHTRPLSRMGRGEKGIRRARRGEQ
jgi:hypothetical protein